MTGILGGGFRPEDTTYFPAVGAGNANEAPTFKVSPWKNDASYMASLRRLVLSGSVFFWEGLISPCFFFLGGGDPFHLEHPIYSNFGRELLHTNCCQEAHGDIAAAAHRKAQSSHEFFLINFFFENL